MATESNFSSALSTWKDINLVELQKTLDAQGLELVENQKESMVGRKKLAESTREFKKLPDDAKVDAFKGLLKSYQGEIDALTRRNKTAESAFLNVYKLLAEAPDPYPLLDAAVDQAVKVAEARVLESTLSRVREENAELKRKVEEGEREKEARRRAEEKVERLESRMEEMIQEKVMQKENELNATYDERIRNFEERERDLSRQMQVHKDQLRDLRTSNDSTQAKLLDHTQRQDQEVVAKLAELDLIALDLERANSRVAAVEQRNEALRAEIESVRSGGKVNDRVKQLETQITDLEAESARLLRTVSTLQDEKAQAERGIAKREEEIAKELGAKASETESLRAKVRQFADYDEVKRELEIMKYVEFSGGDLDADESMHLPDPNAQKANAKEAKSLESLLVAKTKRLEDELTKLRVAHDELTQSAEARAAELAAAQENLERQRALNERLENDLLKINRPNGDAGAGGDLTKSSSSGSLNALAGLKIGQKSTDAGRFDSIPFAPQADTSILPIVTSQRDRFRQRNAELEEELRKQFESISELRGEIKSLQADNLKLYEKVRYMQSYRDEQAIAGPSSSSPFGASRSDEMGKYRNIYEESMNPFEAFRGREAARAVQALNPVEKGLLTLTRAILGSRRARAIFVVYAIGLHFLVLGSFLS